MKAIWFAIILGILLAPSTTWARKVEDWSYDRLFKEADLVVIADALGFSASKQEWPGKTFEQDRFEGVETTFHANSVLKGEAPLCIHLVHFKYREHTGRFNDGPSLVSFFMKPISIDVTQQHREEDEQRKLRPKRQRVTSKPEYLLFLKKRKDGLYESVSGQMDPGLSVRALFELRSPR